MTNAVRGALLVLLGGAACRVSLSPLQNRIAVGEESFVIFAADGEDAAGDLFAVRTNGGAVYPVTYTRLHETAPAFIETGRFHGDKIFPRLEATLKPSRVP